MISVKFWTNLLNMGSKLKDLHSNDIWRMGNPHNVSIRPLWPTSVHQPYVAAARASKEIYFARPSMTGLVVCMRKTRNSTHIPIYSLEQLNALVLQDNPPPASLPNPYPTKFNYQNIRSFVHLPPKHNSS